MNKRHEGFTLIELLIVIAILEVLMIPLIGFYVLPYRVQANLSELTRVNRTSGLLHNHLSDDVRCADSIEITRPEGASDDISALDELKIRRGEETVHYRKSPEGTLEREASGRVPMTHTFKGVEVGFTLDKSGRFLTVRVDMILHYDLLRGAFTRSRRVLYCSHLENGS